MAALPSNGEYIETRVASQPSSYRRLRKSKSMFSPRNLPWGSLASSTQPTASRTASHSRFTSDRRERRRGDADSRLGRSLSFFRPNAGKESPVSASSNSTAQREAIGLARDQFFRQLEQSKENGSSWAKPAVIDRRPQKTFRKSVRTSSTNSYGSAIESPGNQSGEESKRRGIGNKARNLSASFKNKFKRVFIRSSEGEGALPAQQLHATRPHFGDSNRPLVALDSQCQPVKLVNEITPERSSVLYRDILHIPRQRSSPVASLIIDSDGGIDYGDSRVTSWTNSTAANTVTSRQAVDPNRLSVIQENGSITARNGSLQRSGALRAQLIGSPSQTRSNSLYTKLHHRIQKINDASQTVTYDENTDNISSPRSVLDNMLSNEYKATGSPGDGLGDQGQAPQTSPNAASYAPTLEAVNRIHAAQTADDTGATVRQREARDVSPKRPLRESKSMFFPQSTRIERTKTSPFRQAMQSGGWDGNGTDVISSPQVSTEKASDMSEQAGASTGSLNRSESVYSRRSSGSTPQPHRSSTSLVGAENSNQEDVSIKASRSSIQRKGSSHRTFIAKISPAPSSISRQDRATHQRLRVKVEAPPSRSPHGDCSSRKMGHKREHAQICDDDTDIGKLDYLQTASGGRRTSANPSLRQTSSQPMLERFPLMSIGTQAKTNTGDKRNLAMRTIAPHRDVDIENRPPGKWADSDRALLHAEREDSNAASPKGLLEGFVRHLDASRNTVELPIQPYQGNMWASIAPKANSRSSPERVARLRRMHSSNTLGSPPPRQNSDATANPQTNDPKYQRDKFQRPRTPATDRRTMVDVFLSNRKAPQSCDAQVSAFI
ncbi:MAG: hypothetical protein Q9222_000018 [Ikaeria aurantiellina]